MSRTHSLHHVAGWLFVILALAGVALTVWMAVEETAAQGEPLAPVTPNSRALWSAAASVALSAALALLVLVLLPLQIWGRSADRARWISRLWAVAAAGGIWVVAGYRLNRFTYGGLWRTREQVGSLEVPAAVLEPRIWYSNVGLTLGCAVLAIVLLAVFNRTVPLWRARRAPRALTVGSGLLLVLLVPLALVPPTLGVPRPVTGDVLVISLDATRADRLGAYGSERGLTPHLDRLAEDAIRFDRAYCQEPWTLTSHMSMFTGLYPDVHGLDFGRGLAPEIATLAERLRNVGYRTLGSVYDCFLLNPRFGYADGMTDYRVNGARAGIRARRVAERLVEGDRPAFLFLHFYDPHSDTGDLPYEAAPEYLDRHAPGARAVFRDWAGPGGASESLHEVNVGARRMSAVQESTLAHLYDAGIAETDAAVGEFLDRLRRAGRYEDALIIVLADHGESLGESDHFMHEELIEEVLRIPLLVKLPGNERAGTVREDIAETVDVMPTVLSVLGLEPEAISQGFDLSSGDTGRGFSFHRSGPDHAVTTSDGWRVLYRWDPEGGVRPSALHRAGEEPGDGADRLADSSGVLDEWVGVIADLHRANRSLAARFRGGEVVMDAADEELLRSLGYIE